MCLSKASAPNLISSLKARISNSLKFNKKSLLVIRYNSIETCGAVKIQTRESSWDLQGFPEVRVRIPTCSTWSGRGRPFLHDSVWRRVSFSRDGPQRLPGYCWAFREAAVNIPELCKFPKEQHKKVVQGKKGKCAQLNLLKQLSCQLSFN